MIKNHRGPRRRACIAATAVATGMMVLAGIGGCEATPPPDEEPYQGVLEFEERTLAFDVPGRLIAISVEEGAFLASQQAVARLDDTLERVSLEIAQAQNVTAQARVALTEAGARPEDVRALKASVRAATSATTLAERTLEREASLRRSGAGRPADLDAAQANYAAALARRQELEHQLARVRHGARAEEIDVVRAEAGAAAASVRAFEERLARYVLRSEQGGLVLEVHAELEEFVGIGAPVVTVADVDHPFVDVFVPQQQIDRVSPQLSATLRVDAYGRSFSGRVETIARKAEFAPKFLFSERERIHLVVRVRVRVEDPEHALWAGVPVFVTFGEKA